jgi:hypothetical protein
MDLTADQTTVRFVLVEDFLVLTVIIIAGPILLIKIKTTVLPIILRRHVLQLYNRIQYHRHAVTTVVLRLPVEVEVSLQAVAVVVVAVEAVSLEEAAVAVNCSGQP